MKKAITIVAVLVLLALGSGCAQLDAYMRDRGNDFADCFTVRAGISYGIGARVQVTNYIRASIGMSQEKKYGFFGREPVEVFGSWGGVPLTQLLSLCPLFGYEITGHTKEYKIHERIFEFLLWALATDDTEYDNTCLPGGFSSLGVNWAYLGLTESQNAKRMKPPTPVVREVFFIEGGVTLGALGFDIGFNPAEFVDFLLGWTTLDITGDDKWIAWYEKNKDK